MSIPDIDDVEKLAGSDIISPVRTVEATRHACMDNTGPHDVEERRPTFVQRMKQGLIKHLSSAEQCPDQQIKVRSLDSFIRGYPNLATFKSSSDSYALYRRFGYLQSRLLLEKQDILRVLEQRLEEYDGDHVTSSFTRDLSDEQLLPRQALLEEIEKAFNSYATILDSSQKLLAAKRPTDQAYRSVRNYLDNCKPLHKVERDYILHKHDLITLRPGRDHAWLDRSIDRALQVLHKPFPFLNRIFCSPEDALKSRSGDEVYYTQARIDLCASSLITFMICALLIVPIYLLYSLVKDQDGKLDSHTTSVCIAILLVCTLLFSVVLSLFTRAKRHEILGAAAAYCAVLVVFLGNVPGS